MSTLKSLLCPVLHINALGSALMVDWLLFTYSFTLAYSGVGVLPDRIHYWAQTVQQTSCQPYQGISHWTLQSHFRRGSKAVKLACMPENNLLSWSSSSQACMLVWIHNTAVAFVVLDLTFPHSFQSNRNFPPLFSSHFSAGRLSGGNI